jgi:hypothetical protein
MLSVRSRPAETAGSTESSAIQNGFNDFNAALAASRLRENTSAVCMRDET